MDKLSLDRMVDELIDAYVDWRITCDQVDDAYRSWALGMGSADRFAFEQYMAALDVEEHAANRYAKLVSRVHTRLWGEGPSVEALDGQAGGIGQP